MQELYANPFMRAPQLAEATGRSVNWVREQFRADDAPPHTQEPQPKVLWSDWVEWYEKKFEYTKED
jgi:hypothetical protein